MQKNTQTEKGAISAKPWKIVSATLMTLGAMIPFAVFGLCYLQLQWSEFPSYGAAMGAGGLFIGLGVVAELMHRRQAPADSEEPFLPNKKEFHGKLRVTFAYLLAIIWCMSGYLGLLTSVLLLPEGDTLRWPKLDGRANL